MRYYVCMYVYMHVKHLKAAVRVKGYHQQDDLGMSACISGLQEGLQGTSAHFMH